MEQKRNRLLPTILAIVCILVVGALVWTMLGNTAEEIDEATFRKNVAMFTKIELNGYKVTCVDASRKTYVFVTADRANLNDFILKQFEPVYNESGMLVRDAVLDYETTEYTSIDPNQGSWTDYIFPVLYIGMIIFVGIFLFRSIARQNNQNMDFGHSRAKAVTNMKIRFTDVAGAEEEKEELKEIVDFLKDPKRFVDMGARIPKGVLLVGPPGTGKTLFAKAVAGEAGVPFFSMSGSDFVEMFVGVGASRVRDLFEQAKKNMPCIIFIDEIDAVGRQRGAGLGGGHDEREQTLNQLLVEMDGFDTSTNIIIMAATNRADILDPALLRPGRFDRQIYVHRPDVRGREAILKVHARKKPLGADVNLRTVARITAGFTGADLENLLNEAAILAVRAGRKVITMEDVNEGINKVVMGPQKKSRLVTEPDKRITAYHEAGHAILASALKYCDPVHEVTIIPRGQAAGYTMTRPENDNNHITKQQLLDQIVMTLGGRVAEELVIKNISSGASGDIKSLTQLAHQMVTEWGMSDKIGPLFYGSEGEVFLGRGYTTEKGYSQEIANTIDEEVRLIVEECHQRATQILTEKIDVLHNMARVLFELETIHTEEVELLMKGATAEQVVEFVKTGKLPESQAPAKSTTGTVVETPVATADTPSDTSAEGEVTVEQPAEVQNETPTEENPVE